MSSENASQRFMVNTRVYNEENCNLYLYTTHWVVNKCGVPLLLKVSFYYLAISFTKLDFTFETIGSFFKRSVPIK